MPIDPETAVLVGIIGAGIAVLAYVLTEIAEEQGERLDILPKPPPPPILEQGKWPPFPPPLLQFVARNKRN